MNLESTDSTAGCREEYGGHVFPQLDNGDCRAIPELFRRGVALPLRRTFNTDRRRAFREKTICIICIMFRFNNCHFAAHKFREVLRGSD